MYRLRMPGIANLRIGSFRVSPLKMSAQKLPQATATDPTQCQTGVWRSQVQHLELIHIQDNHFQLQHALQDDMH